MKRSEYYFTRSVTTGYVYGIYEKANGQLIKVDDVTTSTMIRSNKAMEQVITDYFAAMGQHVDDPKKYTCVLDHTNTVVYGIPTEEDFLKVAEKNRRVKKRRTKLCIT